uniref:Uncharacterized protein n=1 Tax=Anas platyrhynchos platyrhynchos TaxID=8840 RepID=A0A493TXE6_ANAPP
MAFAAEELRKQLGRVRGAAGKRAFKDGSQKDLLNFSGTVPVKYGKSN